MIQKFDDFKNNADNQSKISEEFLTQLKENYSDLNEEELQALTENTEALLGMTIGALGTLSVYVASLVHEYKKAKAKNPEMGDFDAVKDAFTNVGKTLTKSHN